MKKLFSIMLALTTLVACSNTATSSTDAPASASAETPTTAESAASSEESKAYKIGFAFMSLSDTSIAVIRDDAQKRCDERGYTLVVGDAGGDPAKQISDVETMIIQGVDAIVVQCVDADALKSTLEDAQSKGIKILSFGMDSGVYDAFYVCDNKAVGTAVGEMVADFINNELNGEAEVAVLEMGLGMANTNERDAAVKETITSLAPNAKIVGVAAALDTPGALDAVESLLQANPNISVVATLTDGAALGAAQAMEASGKDPAKTAVFGSDISAVGAEEMINGKGFYKGSTDVDSLVLGIRCVDLATSLIEGTQTETIIPMNVDKIDASSASTFVK